MNKTIKVSKDYQLKLSHKYNKKLDLHNIRIERKFVEEGAPILNDINFHLETDKLVEFCEFFKQLG